MQIKLKLIIFLFSILFLFLPFQILARDLACSISLETFNFITGDLEIKGGFKKKIKEKIKLNLIYNFDNEEQYINIKNINTADNFYKNLFEYNDNAKKNLLRLFNNRKYKITMSDINNSFNLENLKVIYTFENKKYINSNVIDQVYVEEKNFNNDMIKLINEGWTFNKNFFYDYVGLDRNENFDLIKDFNYAELITNNFFKIKKNNSKEIKKYKNDLLEISFINENEFIYNSISMISIVGDTTYYVSLGGNCPNINKNSKSFLKPVF